MADTPAAAAAHKAPARDRSALIAALAIVVLLVVAGGAAGGWFLWQRNRAPVVAGAWNATLRDSAGTLGACELRVLPSGIAALDDRCPAPWRDYRGVVAASPGQRTGVFALLAPGLQPLLGRFSVAGTQLQMGGSASATIAWQRDGDSASVAADGVNLYPTRAGWPIAGMPTLVDRARYLLQLTWRPDAVVMDVTFFAKGAPFLAGVPPNWDRGDLRVTAYSPSSRTFRSFLGAALGSQDAPNYAVYQADASFAIPANFLDLPDAVRAATERGFSADAIREAALRYWSLEGAAGQPPRVLGMGWLLENAQNQTIYLPALPGQGAVLCIQANTEQPC